MLHAVWEGRAVTNDERYAPGIRSQDIGQPLDTVAGIGVGAGEMIVLTRHDDQASAVRCRVEGCPGKSKPEGVGASLCDCLIQLLLQIGEEISLGRFKSSRIPRLRERT